MGFAVETRNYKVFNANHLQVCQLDFYRIVLFLNIVKAKEQASGFLYSCTHLWPYSYINQEVFWEDLFKLVELIVQVWLD